VTAAPARSSRWKPALLSALVFPGLGQLVTGRLLPALVFGGSSVVLVALLIQRVVRETLPRLPEDPVALFDPLLAFRLAAEIQRDNAGFFLAVGFGIVAVWLASILDALRPVPPRV
jgi:hypothetical protein